MVRTSTLVLLVSGLAWAQPRPGFDIASLNRSVDPCVDFYKFSCGGWQAANPLPADQARYGSFDALQDRNRTLLRGLLEAAAVNKPGRSAIEQKEGDFYAACIDEKAIDARGAAVMKPDRDRIAALKNKRDLAEVMAHMFRTGSSSFFNFGSEQDAKDLDNPRIAVLGFAIECNRFSPVSTAQDFEDDVDIRGNRIVTEARSEASITLPDLPGFFAEMDRDRPVDAGADARGAGPARRPGRGAASSRASWPRSRASLKSVLPVDGVFVSCHGAALAQGTDDPDGDLFEMIRSVVGPDVPVVAVFDLHANVSRRMTDNLSVFVGYLENPHDDIRERGIEAAKHLRECLAGAQHRRHHGQGADRAAADRAADRAQVPTPT